MVALSALPATSWMVPMLVRSRRIEPLLAPVAPVVAAVTVHVAEGAPPDAEAAEIEGAVPPRLLVVREKFPVPTLLTGLENVTVQCRGPAFVGLASARLMEDTVGAVLSMMKVLPEPGVSTFEALSVALDFTV